MSRSLLILCLAGFALAPSLARAHHGQDFLLLESPAVPHPESFYMIANGQVDPSYGPEKRASFAPALLMGVTPRLAFELHAHAERTPEEGWRYEAIAPAVHVLLTDPGKEDGFKAGISAEYEFAAEAHASDNLELRLSMEFDAGQTKWAGNLVTSHERGGDSDVGAALGLRHVVRTGFAVGIEGQGSFRHADGAKILLATYFEGDRRGTIKLGLGAERTESGKHAPTAHFGWVLPLPSPR